MATGYETSEGHAHAQRVGGLSIEKTNIRVMRRERVICFFLVVAALYVFVCECS